MIKFYPVRWIHLVLVLTLLYASIIFQHTVFFLVFLFSLGLLWRRYGYSALWKTCLISLVFGSYLTFQTYRHQKNYDNTPSEVTSLTMVADSISLNGDQLSFKGTSQGYTYHVFYTLKSKEEKEYFSQLDKTLFLDVKGDVAEAVEQRNFNGFNYRDYLKKQSIYRVFTLKTIEKKVVVKPVSLLGLGQEWRRKCLVFILTNFPNPMRHYMTGLLFGYLDKSFDEMTNIYTSLGIIHLFALSGMQVGFFIGIYRFLFLRLGLRQDTVTFFQIPFSFLYAVLTGFSLSVIRSLWQSFFGRLGLKPLDHFSVTLLVMMLLFPFSLVSVGGILTFSYSLILTLQDTEESANFYQLLKDNLKLSVILLPILIFYFSSFQPLSILLTIFFSVIFDVLLLPSLSVILLLSPFVVLDFPNICFVWMEQCIKWLSGICDRSLIFGHPNLLVCFLLLGGLILFFDTKKGRFWLMIVLSCLFFTVKNPLENEVTVVDIGQGDSIFLHDMSGKNIVIDVGGRVTFGQKEDWKEKVQSANAEQTLIPYLKSRGVGKIDQLVLTHTDTDHMGDMVEVSQQISIGEVLVSEGSMTQASFVTKLKEMKTKVRIVKAGDQLPIMKSSLQVLYPFNKGDGGNNDSIVLYGNLLGKRFLFTGDLEEEGEKALMTHYPNLKVDVLKAGHHGSKGSSSPEFLDTISPQIALISAGQNNRYKHPHQETLERFTDRHIQIYRTDQEGAIRFKGISKWQVETVR